MSNCDTQLPFSQTRLFITCAEVLRLQAKPMHYRDLTILSVERLRTVISSLQLQKAAEDVREKLLLAGRYGTAYIGRPHCLAVMRNWFPAEALLDMHQPHRIDGHARCAVLAAVEAVMRTPYMLSKDSRRSNEQLAERRAKGLVIETHVKHWFQSHWPFFYGRPANEGVWEKPCDHDFMLLLPKSLPMKVDVMGMLWTGEYGKPYGGKREVDIHLCGRIDDGFVAIDGWRGFNDGLPVRFGRNELRSIWWFIVWLNCEAEGLDYKELASALRRGNRAL